MTTEGRRTKMAKQQLSRTVNFNYVEDLEKIIIETHCPGKWLFVDRETGDVWKWDSEIKKFERP